MASTSGGWNQAVDVMEPSTSKALSPPPTCIDIDDTLPLWSPDKTATTFSTPYSAGGSGSEYVPSPKKKFRTKPETGSYRNPTAGANYIVMEENLRLLFKRCQECGSKLEQPVQFYLQGGHLRVETY